VSVAVRKAEEGEAEAVLALYEWLFVPPGSVPPGWDPEAALPRLREAISSRDSAVLVADDDGDRVGLCSAYLDLNSVRFGRRCWVEDLAVDPERRSQGIGKALLDAARSWAAERGATHLELDSGSARADAHRFYERERPSWTGKQYAWWLG
jgi:GNAT superfamily N-acetyltransferase